MKMGNGLEGETFEEWLSSLGLLGLEEVERRPHGSLQLIMAAYSSSWWPTAHHGGLQPIMAAYSSSWWPPAHHGNLQLSLQFHMAACSSSQWNGGAGSDLCCLLTPKASQRCKELWRDSLSPIWRAVWAAVIWGASFMLKSSLSPRLPHIFSSLLLPYFPSWLCSLFAWPACNIEPSFMQHSPTKCSLSLFLLFQSCTRW